MVVAYKYVKKHPLQVSALNPYKMVDTRKQCLKRKNCV